MRLSKRSIALRRQRGNFFAAARAAALSLGGLAVLALAGEFGQPHLLPLFVLGHVLLPFRAASAPVARLLAVSADVVRLRPASSRGRGPRRLTSGLLLASLFGPGICAWGSAIGLRLASFGGSTALLSLVVSRRNQQLPCSGMLLGRVDDPAVSAVI